MTVKALIEMMDLRILAGEGGIDKEIQGGFVGDLLSYVMAHAKEKNIWVTIQGHINCVAVATLVGMSAIILTEDSVPNEDTLEKANEENIPILGTSLSSFEFIRQLAKKEDV